MERAGSSVRKPYFLAFRLLCFGFLSFSQAWADPSFAVSTSLCRKVAERTQIPEAPSLPIELSRGCNPLNLYYGLAGVKKDPAKAYLCALSGRSLHEKLPLSLSQSVLPEGEPQADDVMLMTIFANGVGAPQNLDAAIVLACGLETTAEETDARVKHLGLFRARRWLGDDFSFCDDAKSEVSLAFCKQFAAALAKLPQEPEKPTEGWSEEAKQAYRALEIAKDIFVNTLISSETDFSKHPPQVRRRREQEAQEARLKALAEGQVPVFSQADMDQSQARLDEIYTILQNAKDTSSWQITKEGIFKTERAFYAYRKAFVRFVTAKYPEIALNQIRTWLNDARIKQLKELVQEEGKSQASKEFTR